MKIPASSRQAGDDLVPLINVVFLLLIFFLLAGTLMPAPVASLRYVESNGAALPSIPPGAVFVDAAGRFYLDGDEVAGDDLADRLAHARPGGTQIPVVLDRDVPMQRVEPLLRALAGAGIGQLEIVTVRGRDR